jgi:hypothetical protein
MSSFQKKKTRNKCFKNDITCNNHMMSSTVSPFLTSMSSHQQHSLFATFMQECDLPRRLKGPPQNQSDKRPYHIAHPLPNDVLFGRGRPLQSHHGNLRFHRIINKFREQYKNARKDEKVGTAETPDAITRQDSLFLLH